MAGPVFVTLGAAVSAEDRGYDLRVGPMWFTWPLSPISETLGDGLEAVGAALVAAERRPRPLKLTIPVHASHKSVTPLDTGLEMRRQVRALLNNERWRMSGLFVWFATDSDLNGWYLIGGGDLSETQAGVTFGDFELELSDVYRVGRPATHKPGRRLELADRRSGLAPRDTRGLIYSTDFDDIDLPDEPLFVPGDVVNVLGAEGRTPASSSAGPVVSARRLWRSVAAVHGEAVSYLPDDVILSTVNAYRDLDDPGRVRVWQLDDATSYPPLVSLYSPERAQDPTLDGWRPVYGDLDSPTTRLAVDNGACRVVWLGRQPGEGLALERADGAGAYKRVARVLAGSGVREGRVIELTPERAVIEWRGGARALRVVLQRGWPGPRLEAYDDDGDEAALEITGWEAPVSIVTEVDPEWVDRLDVLSADFTVSESIRLARGTTADSMDGAPEFIAGVEVGEGDADVTVLAASAGPVEASGVAVVDGMRVGALTVAAASTANLSSFATFTGPPDGVDADDLALDDLVLIKDQTNTADNGVYRWISDPPGLRLVRAAVMDSWAEVPGTRVFVQDGDTNAGTSWVCTAAATGTLGTTPITWESDDSDPVLVLLKDQADSADNGVWAAAAGDWVRAAVMDSWEEAPGLLVAVQDGDTNAGTSWVCTAGEGGTLGTTPITWQQVLIAACLRRPRAIVAQLDIGTILSAGELASLSLADAQAIPVLIAR
jgi:hypothetical protein